MKKLLLSMLLLGFTAIPLTVQAEEYVIDTKNAHAFIQFRIQHLGYSWLYGRFNDFQGKFQYDEKHPDKTRVSVSLKTASIDTNHAERDKHLRSKDFFDVSKYPESKFVSTSYESTDSVNGVLKGNLTLHGVTKPITVKVTQIGAGPDPWGGFRRGFFGTTTITLADFGMTYNLGPASTTAELLLSLEGVRQ
jgi:polyisoprenoid-binding protein YceI